MDQTSRGHYDESQIQVLEGLEAVRRRPGMYIGSTDARGLHHLVYELVDNAVDEAMAGFCTHVEIAIGQGNRLTVTDNGRGIPTGMHPKMGISAVEVCLTKLHAGGKFGGEGYKVSGGLHGVGLSVVNALSQELSVLVRQDGKIFEQHYRRGVPQGPLVVVGQTQETGTCVSYLADADVFETLDYSFDTLRARMREMAFLNRGLRITLSDEREGQEQHKSYFFEGGIVSFVQYLNKNKEVLHPEPMYFGGEQGSVQAEVAMQYNDDYNETVYTFANNIHTHEGGTHLEGFRRALTRVVNDYARGRGFLKAADQNLSGEDIREGLTAIVSVRLTEPQFEGQTKTKLGNSEVRGVVDEIIAGGLSTFLEENPSVGRMIVDKCLMAARARGGAQGARFDPPQVRP